MSNSHNEKNLKRKCNTLDLTANDFEDDNFTFRFPKKSKVDRCSNSTRSRGKSRKVSSSSNSQKGSKSKLANANRASSSQLIPDVDAPLESEKNLLENKEISLSFQQESENLTELERSVCSESEKLCPSCKHIVSVEDFSSHFSKCVQQYKCDRSTKKDVDIVKSPKILPCPVCFKSFTSDLERRCHTKSCASKHGLSTEKLISAFRLQEKQEEERLALGLPSPQIPSRGNVGVKQRRPVGGSGGRREKSSAPDLELAFALSRSLAEEEKRKREEEEDKLLSLGLHHVIQEKRRSLVLPQPPPPTSLKGKESRGSKTKKKALAQTVLMTRTKEERERIITEKVAALLVEESNPEVIAEEKKLRRERTPCSSLKQYEDEGATLWNVAATGSEVSLSRHYVPELEQFIKPQNIAVGELLKSLSQIPGRLNYTILAEDSEEDSKEDDADIETTIVDHYCTQLALAELLSSQDLHELSLDAESPVGEEGETKKDEDKAESPNRKPESDTEVKLRKSTSYQSSVECDPAEEEVEIPIVDLTSEDAASFSSQSFQHTENGEGVLVSNTGSKLLDDDVKRIQSDCKTIQGQINRDIIGGERGKVVETVSEKKLYDCVSSSPLRETATDESNAPEISKPEDNKLENCKANGSEMDNEVDDVSDVNPSSAIKSTGHLGIDKSPLSSSPKRSAPSVDCSNSPSKACGDLNAKLIYDWSCLLASGENSDLVLDTKDGEIPIHTLVMMVRCPSILNEIEIDGSEWANGRELNSRSENGKKLIKWKDVEYDCAYSFMVYLYSSVCSLRSKEDSLWMDLYDLSLKYQCSELVQYLEQIYSKSDENLNETKVWENSEHSGGEGSSKLGTPPKLEIFNSNSPLRDKHTLNESKSIGIDSKCDPTTPVRNPIGNKFSQNKCSPIRNTSYEESDDVVCLEVGGNEEETNSYAYHSPDIFDDWGYGNNAKNMIETPITTPPGANVKDSLMENISSPKLVVVNSENNTKNISESRKVLNNKSSSSEDGSVSSKLSLRRKLLETFGRENSRSIEKEMDCTGSDINRHASFDSLPDFHNSLSPDFDYPSANEFVDLTISSENSLDTADPNCVKDTNRSRLVSARNSVDLTEAPSSGDKSGFPSKLDSSGNLSEHLPDIETPIKGDCDIKEKEKLEPSCPSDLASLVNSPIIAKPLGDSSKQGAITNDSSETRLDIGEKNSFNSQTKERTIRSASPTKSTVNETLPSGSSFGMSDETFLKAVEECDSVITPPKKSRPASKGASLYKSKSCNGALLNTFVTPDKRNLKVPVSRLKKSFNVTPLPDYKSMLTPELYKELDKYGIRKLSRKKAVKLLLHIYEQLHPLVTESEAEASPSPLKSTTSSSLPPLTKRVNAKRKMKSKEKDPPEMESTDDVLNSSQSSVTSVESGFECLEETAFPDPQDHDDDDVTPSQRTSLETRISAFIRSDSDLYTKILRYEPIWANELHQTLKLNGLKCSLVNLINFLDEQCITFRLPTKDRSRRRKKRS